LGQNIKKICHRNKTVGPTQAQKERRGKKKRNLNGLDVVRNCKEVCFQARDPPFALFWGHKKAHTCITKHDNLLAPETTCEVLL
jgi:hypothetical protein